MEIPRTHPVRTAAPVQCPRALPSRRDRQRRAPALCDHERAGRSCQSIQADDQPGRTPEAVPAAAGQSRNERAATLKAARSIELTKLSQEFQNNRETMKARHASKAAEQKTVWRQLAAEREKVWSDYRKEFAIPEAGQEKAGHQTSHRDGFREAASGTTRAEAKPGYERRAHKTQKDAAALTPEAEKSSRRDWRARRSAAERKADGSYKKRDRDNDGGGRSRQRDRYDHD